MPALLGRCPVISSRPHATTTISSLTYPSREPILLVFLGSLKISLSFLASQHLDTGGLGLSEEMPGPFPHGITLKKKEGTQISVESQPFRLTRLISERVIAAFQERLAVFEGQRLLDDETVILKLRLQCVHLFQVFLSYVLY